MSKPITIKSLKKVNKTFFSDKAIEFFGDVGYMVDNKNRLLLVKCRDNDKRHKRLAKYSIGPKLKLTFMGYGK